MAGPRGNRGQEGFWRREEREQEAELPKWREPGEKKENLAISCKILQEKWNKEAGTPTEGGGKRE